MSPKSRFCGIAAPLTILMPLCPDRARHDHRQRVLAGRQTEGRLDVGARRHRPVGCRARDLVHLVAIERPETLPLLRGLLSGQWTASAGRHERLWKAMPLLPRRRTLTRQRRVTGSADPFIMLRQRQTKLSSASEGGNSVTVTSGPEYAPASTTSG
jgi:hypothetical protein